MAVRFGVLVLSFLLATIVGQLRELALPLALLTAVAALATIPITSRRLRLVRPFVEAALAALIIGSVPGVPETLLPYLVVPPLVAGLEAGFAMAAATAATSAVVLYVMQLGQLTATSDDANPDLRLVAEWAGLGLATGAVGAWARLQRRSPDRGSNTYLAANELLSQLREVARTLPTGLDEVSLGQSLLADVRDQAPYDRGALYTLNDLGRLLPLTYLGADRIQWEFDGVDDRWSAANQSGRYASAAGSFSDPEVGVGAVLPLRFGDRIIGAVAIERDGPNWSTENLSAAQRVMDGAALQLDTGRLFSEVRTLATMEERRRLAREIHDGIAQEVASLGYVVDGLAADETDQAQKARILELRVELTRIVSELRLSIFDLRSDVAPETGLGSALSSHLRQVGRAAGLTVHLVLDESSTRLRVETETELLRVAQEAVTNARRHAHARNLWVTCRIDPPNALLRVADDGGGLGSPRIDSYGLEIMRERAGRLGGRLTISERVGGGTVVEFVLGSPGDPTQSTPR